VFPEHPPQAIVIAGPNGSGKSTCAALLLPEGFIFINADMIAQELSGQRGAIADLQAGRKLLDLLDDLECQKADFAVETTLATVKLAPRIDRLRGLGYQTHLIFFWLPTAELAVERVAARVRAGGHGVPEPTIRRRFASGLRHFFGTYRDTVDTWRMYDNARLTDPELIASGTRNCGVQVARTEQWRQICEAWAT
jgi:predicted ABC-type ATPase